MAYVEVLEVRSMATQMTPAALATPDLDEIIERASRMFDLFCGVEPGYFEAVAVNAVATTKVIYGEGVNYLRLPPYVPGTLDTTITVPDGYTAPEFVERGGYLIRSSSGILPGGFRSIFSSPWLSGVPITVTAKWGYEKTPADVKLAVIELTINLWRETDPASLKLTNLDNQPLRESLPPRVKAIAKRYQLNTGVAFV